MRDCTKCKWWEPYQVIGFDHGHAFKAEEVGCALGSTVKVCGSYEGREE